VDGRPNRRNKAAFSNFSAGRRVHAALGDLLENLERLFSLLNDEKRVVLALSKGLVWAEDKAISLSPSSILE